MLAFEANINYKKSTLNRPVSPQNHPLLKHATVMSGNPLMRENVRSLAARSNQVGSRQVWSCRVRSLAARLMTYMFDGVLSEAVLTTANQSHSGRQEAPSHGVWGGLDRPGRARVKLLLTGFYRAMLCIRGTSHGPVSVCLCPSVTSRSSTITAKHRITQTTPHDSPGTLVF